MGLLDPGKDRPQRRGGAEQPHCHCQGHRLLVIIGNPRDRSIAGAMDWALTQTTVEHRIHYPAGPGNDPRMRQPSVPNATNDGWVAYAPAPIPPARVRAIAQPCKQCCFYEEVLVVAHGSQQGLWRTLTDCLPDICGAKKCKRFALWVCGSAADVYPHKPDTAGHHYFEWLAFLIGPPLKCPCGCEPTLCRAWNAGQTKKNLKCPSAGECVSLLSAAWFDIPAGPQVNHHAAKLGMDTTDTASPFASPDGRVLRTDICAIWVPGLIPLPVLVTESRITRVPAAGGPGVTVFNGLTVKADPTLRDRTSPIVSPDMHTGKKGRTLGVAPPKLRRVAYKGPRACATLDGCIAG